MVFQNHNVFILEFLCRGQGQDVIEAEVFKRFWSENESHLK